MTHFTAARRAPKGVSRETAHLSARKAVSRETAVIGFRHLFHVKRHLCPCAPNIKDTDRFQGSLPDTELAKDHVEQILDIDPTEQLAQSKRSHPQLFRG